MEMSLVGSGVDEKRRRGRVVGKRLYRPKRGVVGG